MLLASEAGGHLAVHYQGMILAMEGQTPYCTALRILINLN
jgi:hypothetical protein